MAEQTVLATLPDSTSSRRLQVVLVRRHDGRIVFGLREQHYSTGIGWFDQRAVELEPRQWCQLGGFLGRGGIGHRPVEAEPPVLLPFRSPAPDRGSGSKAGQPGPS